MRTPSIWHLGTALALLVGSSLVGCGGGDFGTAVDLPAAQRHDLAPTVKPGMTIELPKAQPFNVCEKHWTGSLSRDGKADCSADATSDGKAHCKASGSDGGTASADFQLGHCLQNKSGKVVVAELRMAIDYEHACKAEGGKTPKSAGSYAVKVFVKDTAGKVLQTLPLAAHTTEEGRITWSGNEKTIAEVRMQPGLGYYIVLAGQASVTTHSGESAEARVDVKSFKLTVECENLEEPSPTTTNQDG